MSYILDALKKSEQERGHGNAPGVQTVHSSSINYHNEKKTYWPYVLIFAVILNLAAILYFIIDKETVTAIQPKTAPSVVENVSVEKSLSEPNQNNIRQYETITKEPEHREKNMDTRSAVEINQPREEEKIDNTRNVKNITAPPAVIEETYAADSTTEVIDYQDLDASIKAQLPTITISAHVYSTNPSLRSIVINNNFLEEGEYIMDNLVLHEITPNGAVLNYQGILFNYGAISSWR